MNSEINNLTTHHLIDGKQTAEDIKAEIANEVAALKSAGKKVPHLAAILVGHGLYFYIHDRRIYRAYPWQPFNGRSCT